MAAGSVLLGCAMALLLLLFKLSSAARYYMKFTFFIVMSMVLATAPIPLMLRRPRDSRNALTPAWGLRKMARFLGLTWEVQGEENIDNTRGAVVLINHQSALDLIVLSILWPLMSRSTVVSKRAILYLFPFGLASWLWGTVFINRSRSAEARSSVNAEAAAVRDRKAKLLLFPEGTRHGGDKLLPFRKGAFHAALTAQSPVQPVVVSKYHHLDSRRKRFGSGHFIVKILPLIETTGLKKDDLPQLLEKTQRIMQDTFQEVSAQSLVMQSEINIKSLIKE